jgi:ribosome-binding factor A
MLLKKRTFAPMTTTRQHKVSRLLQKELGQFFQQKGAEMAHGKMITVTVVRISPDLSLAKTYLSIFPGDGAKEALQTINDRSGMIRNDMGNRLRNHMRHIPEFVFYLDDSLDYIERIDNLLSE